MNSKIKLFWLRDSNVNPIALVAWSIQDLNQITFSTATRNPKDTFDRKFAHNKAIGRLLSSVNEEKSYTTLDSSVGIEASIIRKIMESFENDSKRPKRQLYEAARDSLEFFKTKHTMRTNEFFKTKHTMRTNSL